MTKNKLRVCWISAGVSSFIAGYLANKKQAIDHFIYIDIEDQHPDSMRFIKDCEKVLGREIEIIKSPYGSKEAVIRAFRFVNGPHGAKCTEVLKKRVRKEWEHAHTDYDITYIWGFDADERHRAERLEETMAKFSHEFPLIDNGFSKADAHGLCEKLGVKRPVMYDLGYNNNNCIGCVKGGMGYWNRIREDFPDVFERMAKLEREIGHSCIKGVYLDELDPERGRCVKEILPDCGIACELLLDRAQTVNYTSQ